MKKMIMPLSNSKGMMNIAMALGVAMVVATFMAPLGLYYLNMYNQNEKARLRTQASEIVEGLGKLIYNAYATAPIDPTSYCPTGSSVQLALKEVNMASGQNKLMINVGDGKNMGGKVSNHYPPPPPSGVTVDPNKIRMCLPSDGQLCQEMLGRTYCIDMNSVEIAHLDKNDPSSPQVAEVSVQSINNNPSLWARLRWKTAPLVAQAARWMDKTFTDGETYKSAYAQGMENFGTTVTSPGFHSPVVTSGSFPNLRLRSKQCGTGDPAELPGTGANACVSCSENSVVCVRYSLCMEPGTGATTPAAKPTDCADEREFMQGMVALFPDRI